MASSGSRFAEGKAGRMASVLTRISATMVLPKKFGPSLRRGGTGRLTGCSKM